MADVRLKNVVMKYGNHVALNRVSFECHNGEFFTLFGPSGAGKTTTLELIAGIKRPNEGEIFIGGQKINDVPLYHRDVAMAFENYALYPQLSVYGNIEFPLKSSKRNEVLSEKQRRDRIHEIAELLGIEKLLERRPQELSGGQKQRVSLARAMVRRPRVFLLDEPIAHLDAKLKVAARSTLKRLATELGITIIYVTHDYREALGLSDRILILRSGNVQQIDVPKKIYRSPANDFVAKIVGYPPMNLVDGQMVKTNGKTWFKAERGFEFPLRDDLVEKAKVVSWKEDGGAWVRIGIRPPYVLVSKTNGSNAAFRLPVYTSLTEAGKSTTIFELDDTFFQARLDKALRCKVGEQVHVEVDQAHLHFFNRTMKLSK